MPILRHLIVAGKTLLLLSVALGILYPLGILALAQALPSQASGSIISTQGRVIGSSLLGQPVSTDPQWFQGRPSATDASGETSGGSNLSPRSAEFRSAVAERRAALIAANPDAAGAPPVDALTTSASGLDPHISPAYAQWQAPRVAKARGLELARVNQLIAAHTQGSTIGILGQERVNVTTLNVALADAQGQRK